MKRKMSVAGAFYPNTKKEIISYFEYFNDIAKKSFQEKFYNKDVKALVVPHAGYVYSGFSANLAYKNITKEPQKILIIGPSHKIAFDGISMVDFDTYDTPLGEIKADKNLMQLLESKFDLKKLQSAHEEHSTEVQFPFIKHYFPHATLVELLYSHHADLKPIVQEVLKHEDTLLVISTDLSHFYNQDEANALDKNCIKAVENLDLNLLEKAEACGKEGLKALLSVAKEKNLQTKSIDYRTSGDITGDMNRVVGYYSAIVY